MDGPDPLSRRTLLCLGGIGGVALALGSIPVFPP